MTRRRSWLHVAGRMILRAMCAAVAGWMILRAMCAVAGAPTTVYRRAGAVPMTRRPTNGEAAALTMRRRADAVPTTRRVTCVVAVVGTTP